MGSGKWTWVLRSYARTVSALISLCFQTMTVHCSCCLLLLIPQIEPLSFLIFYIFFSHTMHPYCSFPSLHSSKPFPHRAVLTGISTQHGITIKIRLGTHLMSRLCEATSRRERVPRAGKRVGDSPTPTVRGPPKHHPYSHC